MTKKDQKKKCFVVGPIGSDDSDDRVHADWLLEDIIEPVFDEHFKDFEVTRADKMSNPGQITSQVITSLLDAELVIADLTTLNPNAFYEIGIRHTIQKPIIHVHLEGQRMPFDIAAFRSIKFSLRRPADIRAARSTLTNFVKEALNPDHQVDNPVTFSRGKIEFSENATPAEKLMLEQMDAMSNRLKALEAEAQKPAWMPDPKDPIAFKMGSVLLRPSKKRRGEPTCELTVQTGINSNRTNLFEIVDKIVRHQIGNGDYSLTSSDEGILVQIPYDENGKHHTFAIERELREQHGLAVSVNIDIV
jgi:hypothetical protein